MGRWVPKKQQRDNKELNIYIAKGRVCNWKAKWRVLKTYLHKDDRCIFSLPFKSGGNLLFLELLHFLWFSSGMTSCWETSFSSYPSSGAKQLYGYKEQGNRSTAAPEVAFPHRLAWHYGNHLLSLGPFALSMELLPHSCQTLIQVLHVKCQSLSVFHPKHKSVPRKTLQVITKRNSYLQ